MSEHYIQTHMGKDHVSSDDARAMWACLLGSDRAVASGFEEELALSVPSPGTLHVGTGFALIDGGWYRVDGSGVDLEIPPGSIGMNRKDRAYLGFARGADDVEGMNLMYVTGNPTTGTPASPSNEHPGNILDGDATVWIPFCDVPLSGLTVGKPVMLLGKRAMSPPALQCAECADMQRLMADALSRQEAATAAAWEVVRSIPAELAQMHDDIARMREWLETEQAKNRRDIEQLAAMLANNISAYVMIGDTLAVPTAWIEYDPEEQSAKLAYTSYDEDTGEFSIDSPLTIDSRVSEVAEQVAEIREDMSTYKDTINGQISAVKQQMAATKRQEAM